jgi:hypothetical protein
MATIKMQGPLNKSAARRNGNQGGNKGLQKGKKEAALTAFLKYKKQVAVSTQSLPTRAPQWKFDQVRSGPWYSTQCVARTTKDLSAMLQVDSVSPAHLDIGKRSKYQMQVFLRNKVVGRMKNNCPKPTATFKILPDKITSTATLTETASNQVINSSERTILKSSSPLHRKIDGTGFRNDTAIPSDFRVRVGVILSRFCLHVTVPKQQFLARSTCY